MCSLRPFPLETDYLAIYLLFFAPCQTAFARSAAAELAPKLRVNCIAPSLTDTPLAARMTSSDSMKKALGDMHPIPRIGTADEVAALVEFLLDDATGGWISGQVFSVDGGRSTLRPKN